MRIGLHFLVVAGAIPLASNSNTGLMNEKQFSWLTKIVDRVSITDTLRYVQIEVGIKTSFLCCTIGNGNNGGICYIASSNTDEQSTSNYKAKWITKPLWPYKLSCASDNNKKYIYVGPIQAWGGCGIIQLTGTITSLTTLESVPEGTTEITVKD